VTDHSRLDNFGAQVNQRTDHAAWIDGGANHAARVDAGQGKAGEFIAPAAKKDALGIMLSLNGAQESFLDLVRSLILSWHEPLPLT
jgi:hypothetical protein